VAVTMKGKDVISIHDLTVEEVWQVIKTAELIKLRHKTGEPYRPLAGKTLGMIFQKPSTRTRISFEVAMLQLGGHAINLAASELQLKRGETIADTARVMARYLDGVMIRTYAHSDVVEFARHADVPVINGLTDLLHPCQALSDLFTLYEKFGRLAGLKLAYVGDGNNVCHSLMFGAAKVGMTLHVAHPEGYAPDEEIARLATGDAAATGARIILGTDPEAAVRDADAVYTDVWASMGQEEEAEERRKVFGPYQVNEALLRLARPGARFMHDLPAHRGEEVTDAVMDGPQSIVWDQAENRLHAQKAILALVL